MIEYHRKRTNKYSRRHIRVLQRRARYLQASPGSVESGSYDEAELQSLKFAIKALQEWMAEDPYWLMSRGRLHHIGRPYHDDGKWYVIDLETKRTRIPTQVEIDEYVAETGYGQEVA